MFRLEHICKKYNNNLILDDVTISFDEANLYILTGQNGSGKSTLIRIITGQIFKNSGNIIIDESIAFLPDKFFLPPLMSVKEYIKETLKLYRIKKNFKDIMDEFELPNKLISSLSKGNYQKLGLFTLFYNEKDNYILDEPLDGLDDFAKGLFKKLVEEKLKMNKKIIIALHNKNLFNSLNPKIYQIKDGKIKKKKKRKKD